MKIKAYFKDKNTDYITLVINGHKIEDIDLERAIYMYSSVNYDCVLKKIEECCRQAGEDKMYIWNKIGEFYKNKNAKYMSAKQEKSDSSADKVEKQHTTTLNEVLERIEDIGERKQIEQILQQYQNDYQQEIQFLGEGGDATVFSIGDKVIKFGSNPRHEGVPKTLETFDSVQYNGKKIMRIMPKLELGNVSREDLQSLYNELRVNGYVWNDIKENNVGWIEKDGKKELRIIDDVDIWTEEEILQDKYISVLEQVTDNAALFEIEYQRTHNPKFNINKLGKYFRDYYLTDRKIYVSKLEIDYENLREKQEKNQENVSLIEIGKKSYQHFGNKIAEKLKVTVEALKSRIFLKDNTKTEKQSDCR